MPEDKNMQQMFDFDSPTPKIEPEKVARDTSLPPPKDIIRPDRQLVYADALSHYSWPKASELHDRDTISIDRISPVERTDYTDHRFIVRRGDTVSVYFSERLRKPGVVTGISHARHEVEVTHPGSSGGIWHSLGCIYPALEPAANAAETVSLRSVLEEVNAKHAPEGGFSESDRVPDHTPYTFGDFKELLKSGLTHDSFADFRSDFERIVASKEAILAELKATYKAPQLKALASRMGDWNAKTNTKPKNAQAVYERMLGSFSLDSMTSFSLSVTYEQAITKKVRAVTEEQWNEYKAKAADSKAEREQSLADPQTIADFALFIEAKGVESLSNEQMARWDALKADLVREHRAENGPSDTVTQFESDVLTKTELTIKEGYHDRRNCPLWIVQLGERVDPVPFRELKTKAKMLGGWWSSFKKSDAGFQFYEQESAEKFAGLVSGDADRSDELANRKERKEQTAAERLHDLADEMLRRSDETIERSEASLQNTERRASIQAGVRGEAYKQAALARTLHSVAESLSTGDATYLDGIRHRTHIEELDRTLYLAKWARIRSLQKQAKEGELEYNFRLDDEEEKPLSEDDIRFAKYPYPSVYARNLAELATKAKNARGVKQSAAKMAKRLPRGTDLSECLTFRRDYDIDALFDFVSRCNAAGIDVGRLEGDCAHYQRLQAAKLGDIHELRAALREYLPHKATTRGDDPVKVAERELIGKKLPGFFPTPASVIQQMLELADIELGNTVLEPSCGKGDIVEAVKREHPDAVITSIEMNRTLSDVLAAKGIEADFSDFLQHQGSYDRVVMNPPFENGQDIEHVRHALDLLVPGGRLVAVMSEGPFFRSDAKAIAFREWFAGLGGETHLLPDGAFNTSEAFRQTGVKTRIAVLRSE